MEPFSFPRDLCHHETPEEGNNERKEKTKKKQKNKKGEQKKKGTRNGGEANETGDPKDRLVKELGGMLRFVFGQIDLIFLLGF